MDDGQSAFLSRLMNGDDLVRRLLIERVRGNRVVFTNGVFDLIHRGHIEYLCEAAALGHILVVGLNSDDSVRRLKGPQRPLVSLEDRAATLLALRCVDFVVPFDDDTPEKLIEKIEPHILVKGGDYHPDEIVGADFVRKIGGRVAVIPFRTGYSTSSLIGAIVERYADSCLKT